MASKSIRPSNRVSNGTHPARVLKISRRRQGGAWVRVYLVRYDHNDAVRRVTSQHIRPALV